MPLQPNFDLERGRELFRPVTSQIKQEVAPRDVSVTSSRYSRSSSVSSYAHSEASEASVASTNTAFSEHSHGNLDSEGTVSAVEDEYSELAGNSAEQRSLTWINSRTESPFDPQSRWPSPADAHQDHNQASGHASTSPEQSAPVTCLSQAYRDYVSRRSRLSPPFGGTKANVYAAQQISQNAEANLASIRSSVTTFESEVSSSIESLCAPSAADDLKASGDPLTSSRRGTSVNDKLTCSAEADPQSAYTYPDRSRPTHGIYPVEPVCCGDPASQYGSRGSVGQQGLTPHPRRRKTGSSWQKPPLVRQDDRKMNYVHSLIDVAVSLITFIWPGSQRPLRVHGATQGPDKIGLRYFIEQLLRRSYASHSTLQVALYYCILLRDSGATTSLPYSGIDGKRQCTTLLCGRRMFFASLMLAFKSLQDRNYSARAWSSISGLSIKDINVNETAFLDAIKYRIFVHENTYSLWQQLVHRCADQIKTGAAIPWARLQLAMREQRVQSVRTLEQSSAAYSTDGIAFPTGMHDKHGREFNSNDTDRFSGEELQPSACPPAALSRRQTIVDRSVLLPNQDERVASPADWVRRAEDESAREVRSQAGDPAVPETQSEDVLSRLRPSDARSTINSDSTAHVDPLPPFDPPIEQIAEWTPIPQSPDEQAAVAPPAPRPGTMETPPDVSDEEAPKHVEMSQCFQQSIRDIDSGYESSSPETAFQEDNGRKLSGAETLPSPPSSEHEWHPQVLADDHVATQNPTLQESVKVLLSSGIVMMVSRTPVVSPPCDGREARELEAALKASRTPQNVGGDEGSTSEEQADELFYHLEYPPEVLPDTVDILLDSANSSPAESTYYEDNHAMVEVLEEQALARLDHRQNKNKNNPLPIRTRSKRDFNTYSASHGEALANVKNSRSASKKLRISEAAPSRRQRNRIVTC